MLGLPAADAIDAQLVLGGFPQITQEWPCYADAYGEEAVWRT